MFEYIKVFLLFLAVTAASGIVVMKVAMLGGGESVITPDLRGREIIPALKTLNNRGLYLKITRMDFDTKTPKNRIIAQDPKPGESLKRGRGVRVIISRGSKVAQAPDLTGASLLRAETILARRDMKVEKKIFIYSDKPENEILAQKPAVGQAILHGETMTLLLSAGPYPGYMMAPDFVEQTLETVMSDVKQLGIKISQVKYEPNGQKDRGVVIRQEPVYGSRMEVGSFVSLTASEGMAPDGDQPATYTFLYYTTPEGSSAVNVSITQENNDGEKEIYNRVHRQGDTISLLVEIKGRTAAKIFLDNELAEVRRF